MSPHGEARLNSDLWVKAHIRTCFTKDMPAFVINKGDAERGGILLKIDQFSNGIILLEQAMDFDGRRIWRRLGGENPIIESEAAAIIAKRRSYDSDLWVVEIEDAKQCHSLDEPIE